MFGQTGCLVGRAHLRRRSEVMRAISCHPWAPAFALGCLMSFLAGCGGGHRSDKDYLPPEDKARTALDTALAAWRNGQPAGKIAGAGTAVQAVDSQWQAGQKLASYEIVKGEPGSKPPRFTVKLQL